MSTSFQHMFSITVDHEFYEGPCPDFTIVPTAEAQSLLKRGRIVTKFHPGQLVAAFAKDNSNQPLADLSGRTLRFALRPIGSQIATVTEIDFAPSAELARFTNANSPGTLARDGEASLRDSKLDRQETTRRAMGLVDLKIPANWYANPHEYRVRWPARTERLRVYVVLRGFDGPELASLAIKDEPSEDDPRPPVAFEKVQPSDFSVPERNAPALAAGEILLLFRSTTALPRRRRGRKGITIQVQRGGELMSVAVPQPRPSAPTADVVIRLIKP